MNVKKSAKRILAVMAASVLCAIGFGKSTVYADGGVNAVREGTAAIVFAVKNASFYYTYDGVNFEQGESLGNQEISSGSGFFIGASGEDPKYLVTNQHVIDAYMDAGEGEAVMIPYDVQVDEQGNVYVRCIAGSECELRVYFAKNDFEYATVVSEGDSNKVDLAVLELVDGPTAKRHALQLMAPTEDMAGETVYAVGYPGNAENELSSASKYGVNDSTITKGVISRFVKDVKKGVDRISIDADIKHGNSGGPLVTEDGYVIGINNASVINTLYESAEENNYAINVTELTHFLDQNSIPYEMAGAGAVEAGSNAVLQQSASSVPAVLIVAAVAAAVIIFVVIIILVRKKKSAKTAGHGAGSTAGGYAPAAASTHGAVITGMKGMLANKSYPVGGSIVMGRNSQKCNVCFPVDAQGISGVHCQIRQAGGGYEIVDLGSSNGTYLGSGQKLTPNVPVPIPDGMYFYLGSAEQLFQIKY